MKRLLLLLTAGALLLSSCAINPDTGKRELSPESRAAIDRLAAAAIAGATQVVVAKIDRAVRAETSGK